MDAVLQAMMAEWKADGPLLAALPRWYTTEAPPDTPMPYAICFTISEVPQYTFDTAKTIENLPLQISVFEQSMSPGTILAIGTLLKGVFDFTALTVAGYTAVRCMRVGGSLLREDDGINHLWVQYDIITEVT